MTSHTDRIFKATRREGYSTQWQKERARGPILPMLPEPRRGWWTTDYGRPGGLLAFGLNRLRRFRGAASLTRRTG